MNTKYCAIQKYMSNFLTPNDSFLWIWICQLAWVSTILFPKDDIIAIADDLNIGHICMAWAATPLCEHDCDLLYRLQLVAFLCIVDSTWLLVIRTT